VRAVTAPDGRKWKLGRRWFPGRRRLWRPRLRDMPDGSIGDLGGGDDLGIFAAIFIAILAIIIFVVLAVLLLNVVAIALEILIVAVLLIAGVIGRVVFRKPWVIYAKTKDRYVATEVKGWRASRRALDDMAERIRSGAELEPAPGDRG
jgi:hypothetical protein